MTEQGLETCVVVGTAGHVDHGKSALVLALTGTDPDRLPQEKARGITIDLGFAELRLPSERIVGLVDVPGHGHYVRAMVAGATGVDIALLVVAADDGVMPQTREHVRILELVGVRRMVVALSKADLVDDDMLELAQADVEDFLSSTVFAGCPVVAVSSRTGRGVEELGRTLDALVDDVLASGEVERRLSQPARLPVDRSFNLSGIGCVVTGTVRAGSFAPGDAVELCPGGVQARVRRTQVHGREVDRILPGQRGALNLTGVSLEEARRGLTVAEPGSLEARDRFDAVLTWLGRDGGPAPLKSGERVHVCSGTSQALGRILLFDGSEELSCGGRALAQVRLEEPLALRSGDRFVVMAFSPVELVGGGEVLWAQPPRRTTLKPWDRRLLEALGEHDDEGAIGAYVSAAAVPLVSAEVAHALDLRSARCEEVLEGLSGRGEVVRLACDQGGACYMGAERLEALLSRVDAALHATRTDEASSGGMPAGALRDVACPQADDRVFGAVMAEAMRRGLAERFGSQFVAADLAAKLREQTEALVSKVRAEFVARGLSVPFVEELSEEISLAPAALRRALHELEARGEVEAIGRSYYLSAEAAGEARRRIAETIQGSGGMAAAGDLREALGLSRKYALPLLEYLDRIGFTVRDADNQSARRLAIR